MANGESSGGGGATRPLSSAPAAMYKPTNKHFQHVIDVARTSSTSLIALTPTNVGLERKLSSAKPAPASSTRSQSLPTTAAERSRSSPMNSFTAAMEIEDWFIAPTYVCSVHSTKDGLIESYRHALVPKDEMIQVVVKQIKHQTYSYITPLTFVIKIHHLSHEFKIDYGDYRKFIRTMVATPMFESPIRALYVSKLLEDSFAGAMRRAVASIEYLSKELAIALNDLVQIPHLAAHPTFLKLARIDSFRAIFEVLVHGASNHGAWQLPPAHRKDAPTPMPVDDDEVDNSSNSTEPTSLDGSQDCLCALFAHGTAIFASHIAGDATPSPSLDGPNTGAALVDCQLSVEKVLCMYLMQSRSLLVFYADTLYTLDKTHFNAQKQYQKCIVAGFGAKALFQISRISKTEWALVDVRYPTVALLSLQLQKQSGRKPSVAMYRVLPRGQPSECIGMFYKHRRRYEFQLLSELLTQGKITTSISIASGLVNHKYRHNVLCSVAGGRSDEFVSAGAATALSLLMTSAMSVPQMNLSKQRLHVSDGADVLLHIGLAVSFDILMSARPLFQRSDFIY